MDFRDYSVLDENQKYDLVRRAIIYFFSRNHKNIESFGYKTCDFQPTMKFIRDIYYSHLKRKEEAQNVKISNDTSI